MLPPKPDVPARIDDLGDASRNPYAPPGSHAAAPVEGATVAPYRRVATISVVLGAGFGVFLGVAQTLQFGAGLSRFGGMTYVPRVVVLTTVRALGAGAAMLVTCVSATIALHQSGRRASGVAMVRDARVLWLTAGGAATFAMVCAFTTLAGALTAVSVFGASMRSFLGEGLSTLTRRDVEHGAVLAAINTCIVTVFVPVASRWLTSERRSLILKLVLAYATVQATAFAEQWVLASLET
jgi:hypothetical protein